MHRFADSHLRAASLLAAALLASPGAAQQFLELGKQHWPTGDEPASRVVAGDLDGDGDLDIVTGSEPVRVFHNLGSGCFAQGPALTSVRDGSMVLFDADGDGDLDLLVVSDRIDPQLWRNDGAGGFQPAAGALPPVPAHCAAAGDLDGDGDLDLIVGRWLGAPMLWRNDGTGRFTDVTATHMPALERRTTAVALADVDGDGDLDVFLACAAYVAWPNVPTPGFGVLCTNDGRGRFTDVTAGRYGYGPDDLQHAAFADVDADSHPDLIVLGTTLRVHRNDGRGNLTAFEVLDPAYAGAPRFSVADLDGDAIPDLLPGTLVPLRNDGAGRFTRAAGPINDEWPQPVDVALADVDGDGDADLLVAGAHRSRLLLNDGRGKFTDATARALPVGARVAHGVFADLDGDGDLDAVTRSDDPRARAWRNDGRGGFQSYASGLDPFDAYPIVVADVDGDGAPDVLGVDGGTTLRLFANDGGGRFTDVTRSRLPPATVNYVVAGDVDGDGDVDLVTSEEVSGPITLLINAGNGTFTARVLAPVPAFALCLLDVDGDGDLDLIAGKFGEPLRQFRNDGSGTFREAPHDTMPGTAVWATDFAAGDVDGDGDPDLVVARDLRLFRNDGSGTFRDATAASIPSGLACHAEVALGDVDEDGDLDLAGAHVLDPQTGARRGVLLVNDGRGVFTAAPQRTGGRFEALGARFADVDGDGDLDLFDARALLVNRHRHCHTPWLARLTHPWRIDLWSQPGYGPPVQLAIPLLSDAPGALLVPPLGRLRLAPDRTVPLAAVPIGQDGVASLVLPLSDDVALLGVALHLQAVVLTAPDPRSARFTNAARDAVGPR